MAKKSEKPKAKEAPEQAAKADAPLQDPIALMGSKLPQEMQEKLNVIKKKLDEFKTKVLEKFGDYVIGISLLPPPKPSNDPQAPKIPADQINVLLLIDDSDSQKMSKEELRDKLAKIIISMAAEIDKNLAPQIVILSELWQSCYDSKYDLVQLLTLSAPIHDTGMIAAIKVAEVHKEMVLQKFEKYIVSYVLAGSLVQGKATPESDVDVFIVIDDTDVKKMTRAELKDKLRAIIIGMGFEAGNITGVQNKINIQIYILTDFWDFIKEASPVIFTFLRDGIPLYDRGIFMPWKQLLKMGRIRPSTEAIDMYMSSGEQIIKRINFKLSDIAMEDLFYATLTPSQAAIMLYGMAPPTPKETPAIMRELFVKKEKLLEEEHIQILQKIIDVRKQIEHGKKTTVTGKEVDELLVDADKYLKRLSKLFEEINAAKEKESMLHLYETTVTIIRDLLKLEGVERVKDTDMIKIFEDEVVCRGKIPEKYLRQLNLICKAKKDFDAGKLTKPEVEKVRQDTTGFIKFMVEYMQRKRGIELERAKIRVKHGQKYGEVILLDKVAFIVHDIDKEEKDISKAEIDERGKLIHIQESSLEELEAHLAKVEIPLKVFIKEPIFEDLKEIFGKDVEVLVNY